MRAPDTSLVGAVLGGRYRVKRVLASGGMGAVYEGEQLGLGRPVAIKVMHPMLSEDTVCVARFEREARVVAALEHPNIAQVYDFHEARGGEPAWIAMELVHGSSLAHIVRSEGALAPERVVALLVPMLGALEAAHGAGVVHRDLKPGNIMVASIVGHGEVPKLLDFGIAKLLDGEGYQRLTQTGAVVGTPAYMAPEIALARPVDARADLYAMGVITQVMLTGKPVFAGASMAEVLKAVLDVVPPLPSTLRPGLPPQFDAFVARALQKRPEDRFASAREMADAARALLAPSASVPPTRAATPAPPATPSLSPTTPGLAPKAKRRSFGLVWAIAIAALLVVASTVVGLLVLTGVLVVAAESDQTDVAAGKEPPPTTTTTQTGEVAPPPAARPAVPPLLEGTMRSYLSDALARAAETSPGAKLYAAMGFCVDARGRVASVDPHCGWLFDFALPDGSAIGVVYDVSTPLGSVQTSSDPVHDTFPRTDDLPDSDAVMTVSLTGPCSGETPGQKATTLSYVYEAQVSASGAEVDFSDPPVPRHEWTSFVVDGRIQPTDRCCVR